mgnify:CR=1 FL=1
MTVKQNFIFTGGKITRPLVFPDGTVQSTASTGGGSGGGDYLPLTGGTLTGGRDHQRACDRRIHDAPDS